MANSPLSALPPPWCPIVGLDVVGFWLDCEVVRRMNNGLAGVVLAAGAGQRLAPLTRVRPKALCPVGGRPLVLLGLERVGTVTGDLAVNLHHGAAAFDAVVPPDVHRSVEQPVALGTAGALGALRSWLAGRAVLITNADAWFPPTLDLTPFVDEWDGDRVRLLCVEDPRRGDFGSLRYCGVALMPWSLVGPIATEPSGLYEVSWRQEAEAGRLDLVTHAGEFVDCGTPADYLRANLLASGGESVVSPAAEIGHGARIERSVVWDNSRVEAGEVLVDAIRAERLTVLVR